MQAGALSQRALLSSMCRSFKSEVFRSVLSKCGACYLAAVLDPAWCRLEVLATSYLENNGAIEGHPTYSPVCRGKFIRAKSCFVGYSKMYAVPYLYCPSHSWLSFPASFQGVGLVTGPVGQVRVTGIVSSLRQINAGFTLSSSRIRCREWYCQSWFSCLRPCPAS